MTTVFVILVVIELVTFRKFLFGESLMLFDALSQNILILIGKIINFVPRCVSFNQRTLIN